MPISNFSNGISHNYTMREFPILELQNGKGNVFWIDSNKGSDGNKGTYLHPFATLDYAVGRCTADQGDKIFVAAGHAETITSATDLVLDIAGIQILGLGTKENRPVYTFTTDTAASAVISADDVFLGNLVFKGNIASQVTILDCNAKRTVIDGCLFTEGTEQPLTHIDINGGGANICDGIKITNCLFNAPTANATAAIELGEVADNVVIENCTIWGDFDDAGIHNPTGKILTNLTIKSSTISNNQTGDHAIELVSACTGIAQNLYMYADGFSTAFDPGALKCFETYSVSAVDVNGRLNPVIET